MEPGDIVITAEMDPAAPDPGLRGFLLHRKLGDLGRIRAARPDVAELRLGRLDGPVQIVLTSSLDVSQIEGYLSLVPDLLQVHVRREDPPKAVHAADPPEPPTLPPEASPPAFDEPMLPFSEDFGAVEVPTVVDRAVGERLVGNGFGAPSATPQPAGFSEFDFEDLLGDTIREAPREERPSGVLAPTSAGRTPTLPPFERARSWRRSGPRRRSRPRPDDHPSVAEAAIVRAPRAARSVRVRTDWLDAVLNRTGDLLIIAQRLWNRNQNNPDPVMTEALSELSRVLSALHQDALSVRMTPLSVLTVRLPRAVRDMARRSGKRAVLVTRGDDQHLDRAIIEGLDAPLTHLLSNAVEHGIELPELREAQGKRPGGTIQLVCTRVRDEIVVEVSDDGAGVDREKLANRAVEMGLLSRGRAEQLAERDLGRLMCLPGLTSRDEPGENAGRGVGLDAVREMVTGLGGTLEMQSEAGHGTTIRLRLPRTPGISKLLLVEADAQVFGLPLARVLNTEMFDPAARSEEQGMSLVEHQGSRLRVFPLRHLLGLPRAEASDRPEVPFPGVVCHGDEGQFVLTVDRVVGQQDAVMKPLGPLLERIDGLLGVTIDPVGKPVFIVDVLRFLARRT